MGICSRHWIKIQREIKDERKKKVEVSPGVTGENRVNVTSKSLRKMKSCDLGHAMDASAVSYKRARNPAHAVLSRSCTTMQACFCTEEGAFLQMGAKSPSAHLLSCLQSCVHPKRAHFSNTFNGTISRVSRLYVQPATGLWLLVKNMIWPLVYSRSLTNGLTVWNSY